MDMNTTIERSDLTAIANQVNSHHAQAESDARDALAHAIEAGKLLNEAKAIVGHGAFTDWLAENFDGSARSAQRYMRIADRLPALDSNTTRRGGFGIAAAGRLLASPRAARPAFTDTGDWQTLARIWWDLAAKYTLIRTAQGWTAEDIAEPLGLGVDEVNAILCPVAPLPPVGLEPDHAALYHASVEWGISLILGNAYRAAVHHARQDRLSSTIIRDLEGQMCHHARRCALLDEANSAFYALTSDRDIFRLHSAAIRSALGIERT